MADTSLTLKSAQNEFMELLNKIEGKQVAPFLQWVQESFSMDKGDDKAKYIKDANELMMGIAEHLKQQVPTKGYLKTEKINFPTQGLDSECNDTNTIHVDCFLFDDDAVDDLVQTGELSRNYCVDCGSKNTKPLTFISHSLAPKQLEFMFTSLVPLIKQKEDFSVVDIGSRLGPVIFAAHLYSTGKSKVLGIEMNEELCKIQRSVIEEFQLTNIDVICSDVRNQEDVIQKADMVIMNNVFNFFLGHGDQLSCWEFLHQHLKPGCILIHHPSIEEASSHLELPFKIEEWVEEVRTTGKCAKFACDDEELFEDCSNLHMYKIRPRE